MFTLQILKISIWNPCFHFTLNLFFLLSQWNNMSILISDHLRVLLHLLVDAFVRRLFHGVIKLSHAFVERWFPGCLGVILEICVLSSDGRSVFLLGIKLIILSMPGKNNTKISLPFKLINSLLKSFINTLHFEMLFLHAPQISSHPVDIFIVSVNDVLILIKLCNIGCNQLINVIFNALNLVCKFFALGSQFFVFGFLFLVFLLGSADFDLEVGFFIDETFAFIFKFGNLLG